MIVLIFLLTSAISYAGIIYNSNENWKNNPQIELSGWMSTNIDKNSLILIDEDNCGILNKNNLDVLCTEGKSTALAGLWVLNPISIKSSDSKGDYLLTRKKLGLEEIKNIGNNTYLYKIN